MDISKWTIPEMLKHISELPAKDRVNAVQQISKLRPILREVLGYTYHKNFNFTLPAGDPPYNPMNAPDNMGLNRLHHEMRKFKYFVNNTQLNTIKREKIFIELLESLSKEEAQVVLMMKNKKLTGLYKNVTRKLVEDALPDLFAGEA